MKKWQIALTVVLSLIAFALISWGSNAYNEYKHPKLKIQRMVSEITQEMDEINNQFAEVYDLQVRAGIIPKEVQDPTPIFDPVTDKPTKMLAYPGKMIKTHPRKVYDLDPDVFKPREKDNPIPPIKPEQPLTTPPAKK